MNVAANVARQQSIQSFYTDLYRGARKGAEVRGLSFELTRSEFDNVVRQSQGCCMLTGIPFDITAYPGASRRPFAPSLDRINSHEGYTPRNVRLVCVIVNYAMNQWGLEPLKQIAERLVGGYVLPSPPPIVHTEHVWQNVTYMTVYDYIHQQGRDDLRKQTTNLARKVHGYCVRKGIQYIDVCHSPSGILCMAFPLDVLELYCR